jgi:medium-chain acyl-[acyl-carrier-protein] hydrolase
MQYPEVLAGLREYVADEVLEGRSEGLEPTTPLLEWGVINSMEIVRLIAFIKTAFAVDVPSEMIMAENFKDLQAITALVLKLACR